MDHLAAIKGKAHLLILQNNWNINSKIPSYLDRRSEVSLAFPSSVGGGRKSDSRIKLSFSKKLRYLMMILTRPESSPYLHS